ncbi:MAG: hypothetical protein IK070_01145 [Clostridia bacterium]|nr:hypothetical protein [Clostridia bacterium]
MPISFIVLGISLIYFAVLKENNIKKYTLMLCILSFCMVFVTQNIQISQYIGINLAGVLGCIFAIGYACMFKCAKINLVFFSVIQLLIYVMCFKANNELHYLFNYIPTFVIMFIPLLFIGNIKECLFLTVLNVTLISGISLLFAQSNFWYGSFIDVQIVSIGVIAMCIRVVLKTSILLFKYLLGYIIKNKANI